MLATRHDILSSPSTGMTPRRALTLGGVGLLHVAAIYALINGMGATALKQIETVIQLQRIETTAPPKPVLLPPTPHMQQPAQPQLTTAPIPQIDIATTDAPPIFTTPDPVIPQPAVPDSGASGLSNTHSTPPYPVEARTLAHQGTVLLQMVVTAQGDVASASVVTSSGFAELDQAAINWVVGHWKYKPAIQSGNPVASQTQAAVKFDLKQARR